MKFYRCDRGCDGSEKVWVVFPYIEDDNKKVKILSDSPVSINLCCSAQVFQHLKKDEGLQNALKEMIDFQSTYDIALNFIETTLKNEGKPEKLEINEASKYISDKRKTQNGFIFRQISPSPSPFSI